MSVHLTMPADSIHLLTSMHPNPSLLTPVGMRPLSLLWFWQQVVMRECGHNKCKSLVKVGNQVGPNGLLGQGGEVRVIPYSPAPARQMGR